MIIRCVSPLVLLVVGQREAGSIKDLTNDGSHQWGIVAFLFPWQLFILHSSFHSILFSYYGWLHSDFNFNYILSDDYNVN